MKIDKNICRAFTLVETMLSVGCASFILAAVVAAGVCLQKSFAAVEGYSNSEGSQLRVLDYIAMDCRRALTVSVVNNTLTLTLPVYYDANNNYTPIAPTLSGSALSYGSGSVTINYKHSGNNFTREVIIQDSGGATISDNTTAIATNVSSFTVVSATSGTPISNVSCYIMFFPTFTHMTGTGTWRSGGSAPGNGTGVNSDWYVIDTTASDPTTVGNVYFKSGGTYSLLENIKATTVYCNTFLRNAGARGSQTLIN
jgi:hypothetical protein